MGTLVYSILLIYAPIIQQNVLESKIEKNCHMKTVNGSIVTDV